MGGLRENTALKKERALLLAVNPKVRPLDYDFQESLQELAGLTIAAGAEPVETMVQNLPHPHPGTYFGKGKLEEVAAWLSDKQIDLAIVDDELTPAQHKNLSTALELKIIDRTHLILDIFARRAQSHVSKLQVELAQLTYLFPRLVGMWSHFEKQEGAIGTRGPGETQLESDRRILKKRMQFLTEQLERVSIQHTEQRKQRQDSFNPIFALVGYTNAGKTSILNRLASEELTTDNAVFTTLDPHSRKVQLKGKREVIISDTVGFIQRIPHSLIKSFKTTLEEVQLAHCLLHVIDVQDNSKEAKMKTVMETLREIFSGKKLPEVITVFNKTDGWSKPAEKLALGLSHSPAVFISAKTGDGVEELLEKIGQVARRALQSYFFKFPHSEERLAAMVYQEGMVEREHRDFHNIYLKAAVGPKTLARVNPFLCPEGSFPREPSGDENKK